MQTFRVIIGAWIGLALVACSSGTKPPDPATVGPSGTKVTLSGVTIDVPQGAVAQEITLTVSKSSTPAPSGYTAFSPVYVFGPEGTHFDKPITVSLPYSGSSEVAIYWSRDGAPGYDALPTTRQGGFASAQVTHFSSGFVGAPPDGGTAGDAVWDSAVWDQNTWQ